MTHLQFDDIVIGAGSSGCVMAARLSENPDRRVLLLEAGPDFATPDEVPAPLRNAHEPVLGGFNWSFAAQVRAGSHGIHELVQSARVLAASPRDAWSAAKAVAHAPQPISTSLQTFPYVPGKVVGGSSAVNGAVALRPAPEDFAAWLAHGGDTWTWEQVLPFFRKLESDRDFAGPTHGVTGPVPVVRPTVDQLSPAQASFRAACRDHGIEAVDDLNGAGEAGVGMLPSNTRGDQRVSTALAYLMPARSRPNLHVLGERLVTRILFDKQRAVGVQAMHRGATTTFHAGRVSVCAGTINTPAILLRSGLGDSAQCMSLDVEPVAHLPGVGSNLIDHPAVMFWMVPREFRNDDSRRFAQHQVMARVPSRAGGRPDLNLFFLSGFATSAIPMLGDMLGSPVAHAMSVVLSRPLSRGRVALTSAAPTSAPLVELNLGSAAADVERLMAGARLAWSLARSETIRALAQSVFMWNDTIMRSDTLLRNAILRFLSGTWHAVGTARIGRDDDPMAVVDARCRVRSVSGLYVVDASVMPDIPSTPTNLTCIMLAERVAAWMTEVPAAGP